MTPYEKKNISIKTKSKFEGQVTYWEGAIEWYPF